MPRRPDITYIRPGRQRDDDARANALSRGHVLGPWYPPDGGLDCYYAAAACVRCGAQFYLAYVYGGGYDGWAAYKTCAQTRSAISSEGNPSIYGRAVVPGRSGTCERLTAIACGQAVDNSERRD